MATHEPDQERFDRQLESILQQSHRRLVCIVSDDASSDRRWSVVRLAANRDARVSCTRSDEHIGFYRNFERCLSRVPSESRFVALADQDDVWHRDKLTVLVRALEETGALLVYSDMHVVSAEGALLAPTYWEGRRNNFTDLASLLLANTVTGAASVFRRELLEDSLPFPREIGNPFHDHWLACVALARGTIAYVDRPLQDYVQHGTNVTGSFVPSHDYQSGMLAAIRRLLRNPRRRLRNSLGNARRIYFDDVRRLVEFARTLRDRLDGRLDPARAAELERFIELGTSYRSLAWLVTRSARDLGGDSPSIGVETQLIKGVLWRHLHPDVQDDHPWAASDGSETSS
jgi:glycosyltransferase involved in cell wall biosynthesis